MPAEREVYHILTNLGEYRESPYNNEKELERLVIDHAEQVFGKGTLYIGLKQRVESKLRAGITDGFLLDFRNRRSPPHLWIVEFELYSHDFERHVIPQLRRFVKAFDNEETITSVTESMYEEISGNEDKLRLFKELAGKESEVHRTVSKALHSKDGALLLVYDRLPENVGVIMEESDFVYNTTFLEFRTFHSNPKSSPIHLLGPFLPERGGPWKGIRREEYKPVEGPHWTKAALEKEVLKLLFDKKYPLGRKEIIAELKNRLTLSEADKQILRTQPRWEAYTRFAISDLSLEKGGKLIEARGKNQWVITNRGKKALTDYLGVSANDLNRKLSG